MKMIRLKDCVCRVQNLKNVLEKFVFNHARKYFVKDYENLI